MKKVLFFLMVALYSCCNDDCPDPAASIRFNLVDAQTNHNLVFGEHAIYDINKLKVYSTRPPRYEGDTDTIFNYGLGTDKSETYIQTIIDGLANEIYLKLNEKEIDTLTSVFSVTSKDCGCEYYKLDMVRYNDHIICQECKFPEIYTIYK